MGSSAALREFEFDDEKSAANATKHGIDFVEAQDLWSDERMLVASARFDGETRFMAIGRIASLHWTAIYTLRDASVRIISVRRARRGERALYEGR